MNDGPNPTKQRAVDFRIEYASPIGRESIPFCNVDDCPRQSRMRVVVSCDTPIGRLPTGVSLCDTHWRRGGRTMFESSIQNVQFSVRRMSTEEALRVNERLPSGVPIPCLYRDCETSAQWCYFATLEIESGTVKATIALCAEHLRETSPAFT